MVNSEQFKDKVKESISQDYGIEFLGKNFDQIVSLMSDSLAEMIYNWIKEVVNKSIQPITVGSKKPYKEWTINQLLVFRYPFQVNKVEYRILFVKIKNSIYLEFHLGDHNYYDKIRRELDLKKEI